MAQRGKQNPNWRGGRSITSHGYVIVRVGKEHHLADVRGYAYEHRIVIEQKLGRRLRPGEMVHHINEDPADNRPENLRLIISGNAEHYVHHRKRKDLRLPGEANPIIRCKCGCRAELEKYDSSNRPRQYVSGHNPQPAPTQQEITRALERGAMHRQQLASVCGVSPQAASMALQHLKRKGLVYQISRGVWALREGEKSE